MDIVDLGQINYAEAWRIQQEYLERRKNGEVGDTLLLVQHPPTISLGTNAKWNVLKVSPEELAERGIDFHKSKRGGGAAYLGPGQIVGYTIMEMTQYGGVHKFMRGLEEVMIRSSKRFGIDVQRCDTRNPSSDKPYRATWYFQNGQPRVLCTKGIGVKAGRDGLQYIHHGFSLNVHKNDSYYGLIDPCGFPIDEVRPISFEEILDRKPDMEEVKSVISEEFRNVFNKG